MTQLQSELTPTSLMAIATDYLERSGFTSVGIDFKDWNSSTSRLFEDVYSVVGVVVFQTCADLVDSWRQMQGSMVDVISQAVGKSESKAWDGYLILLTPGPTLTSIDNLDSIRNDTKHLRKLVATGDDLTSPSDVERLLATLRPLATSNTITLPGSELKDLQAILVKHGISTSLSNVLIQAFLENRSLMDALHDMPEAK